MVEQLPHDVPQNNQIEKKMKNQTPYYQILFNLKLYTCTHKMFL